MNRQVLFVQGGGEGAHDEWDDKLVASLRAELGPAYEIRYPRMPFEADPMYDAWAAALEREIAALDDGAMVVGHSLGGAFLITALAERPPARELGAVVLIAAPFVGEGGWREGEGTPPPSGATLPRRLPIYVFHGAADVTVPVSHAELYAARYPQARVSRLPGRDHQLNNDLREVAALIESLAR